MNQPRRRRNIKTLWGLILLAIVYSSLLYYLRTLTGKNGLDGIIGVLLGLYICSYPTANVLDIVLFGRSSGYQVSSRRSNILWLALNVFVLLSGWIVIFIGATRFVTRAS